MPGSMKIKSEQSSYAVHNLTLACLLEASISKPGNVSPTHAFHSTKYEHYLAGSVAVGLNLGKLADPGYSGSVGEAVYQTVDEVSKRHSGGNTHLGIILLLAPLAKAVSGGTVTKEILRDNLKSVLNDLDYNDTVWYFKAINQAKPGGLLPVDTLDVRDDSTLKEIQDDKIDVKQWMSVSSETNSVSYEYCTDYQLTFEVGLPYFTEMQAGDEPIRLDESILRLYLKFLAMREDSLVLGKFNEETANKVKEDAIKLLNMYESRDPHAQAQTQKFHDDLVSKSINPGMSADLTAAALYLALTLGFTL